MNAPLTDQLLSRASAWLTEAIGLHFPPARWRDLRRGIASAAPALGFRCPLDCTEWIAQGRLSPEQLDRLAPHLTVSETYFFRDTALFQYLESVLLPDLIQKKRAGGMGLRLWCAGCCTGEEAYSLAILLHRLIPDLPRWNLSLLATDINVDALAKAREGCYSLWSFRGTSAWNDTRYFTAGPGKCFTVRPEVRAAVRFESLNLASSDYPSLLNGTSNIDVLICRNVLMYFEPGAANRAMARLADAISEEGWLIVAPSELPLVDKAQFAPVHRESTILHQKSGLRLHTPVPPPIAKPFPRPAHRPVPPARPAANPNASPVDRADAEFALSNAEDLFAAHQHEAAWDIAVTFTGESPARVRAMRLLARICADQGRLAEAQDWCDRIIAEDRVDPAGYYLRALVLRERGLHIEAGDALRQTLYLDPDFIIAHFTLGALAHARGDAATAARHWRNTIRLLGRCAPEASVPESDGLSAARLLDIVESLMEREVAI
ncbi:MAG: tetratricopeptide repeat protein [Candidatus Hydrogenedentes bacterium]|nr:tetratricopeptide repeat protein [Candidatus Hydrogenedentota bacterium]